MEKETKKEKEVKTKTEVVEKEKEKTKKVNKKLVTIIVIVTLLLSILVYGFNKVVPIYNNIVTMSEEVDKKFSDIDVLLERRIDLIPNLVNTVKGYTKHEEQIIKEVTDARSKLLSTTGVSETADANAQLTEATHKMLMLVEKYPELKANEQFINLQDELAGTENRIAVARKEYNVKVKEYNDNIIVFPNNIISSMFGFDKKEYFKAKDSANEAPNVSFED